MKGIAFYRPVWGLPGLYVGGEGYSYQIRESGLLQLAKHPQKGPATLALYLSVFTDCLLLWHYLG